ncbi:MAG: Type 1 glutamine amidotransferase-like domain-containing protein, partial [Clostridia bacterium]|nr:Type 1 glutamine amidotransferase-like domain-containing protein [Clostridia bacterium]
YVEMNIENIKEKFDNADMIYIGGGDTVYMLEKWKETGIDKLILDAYDKGKIIAGLSAGAICWFNKMYTDYEIMRGVSGEYSLKEGLGILNGTMCPHFNEREEDFTCAMKNKSIESSYCVENDCAIEFINGNYKKTISAGGKAYLIKNENGKIVKEKL